MKCKRCKREIAGGSTFCNWCGKKQVADKKLGEVSVPEPRELPSGKFFIQLRFNGQSVSITEDSEDKCKAKARAIKSGLLEVKKKPVDITLRMAIDRYIESKSNTISPSTIRGYRTIQNNRFQSVMDEKLKNITDWQTICNKEAKLCSAKTLRNAYRFIASVLSLNNIDVPKVTLPQIVSAEREWLTPEQITVFIKALRGTEVEIPALLALHSLRRSEICALTWDKIDFKNQEVQVKGAAVFNEEQKLVQKDSNKNKSSRRSVPFLIPELEVALSAVENKSGFIVLSNPNTIWARINRICEANGLPKVGVHGLRHSFASLAYHLGMPEKIAMQIGGWSDYKTMHKIYTHLSQKDIAKHTDEMKQFYQNANKIVNVSKKDSITNAYNV